jgi:hypothetical protein
MTWNLQYDFYPKTASYIDDWKVGSYKESMTAMRQRQRPDVRTILNARR